MGLWRYRLDGDCLMPWLLLLKSPWTWIAIAFAALASYAAVQHIGWQASKAEYAQFRADTERLAAEAKVKNAQEAARHAQDAQEALDDLQTSYDALNARYASLRRSSPGRGGVPGLASAATSLSSCPVAQPDAASGRLADLEARVVTILESGDREIAKYRQLWELEQKR